MRFIFRDRAMFNPLGDHKNFTGTKHDHSVSKSNAHAPAEDKEKVVRILMLVPNKLALHFDYQQVMSIELADDAGLPVLCKRRQLVG